MVTVRHLFITALVAAAGIIIFFWFFTGDEAKIKKQFKNMAELISKDSDEHQLMAAASAGKIAKLFTETCRIKIPSHSISGSYKRENIPAHAMAARSRYSVISLKFHDTQISFPDESIARIAFTAFIEAVSLSGEPIREVHEFVCWMKKLEKDWFFSQIEAISVLER